MNRQQVAALISYAAGLDPRTALTDEVALADQLDQWADLLSDVPPVARHPNGRPWNAAAAVRDHISRSPYPIKPSDVSRPWHAFKADVLQRHTDPTPTADPDDAASWRAELLGTRAAVATGQALPNTARELTSGGPAPSVADRLGLARIGEIPAYVREQVAPRTTTVHNGKRVAGPARTARLAALAVACPRTDCRALRNRPCKRPSGAELRTTVHDQRQTAYDAALTTTGADQ